MLWRPSWQEKSVAESYGPSVEPEGSHASRDSYGYPTHHLSSNRRFWGSNSHSSAALMADNGLRIEDEGNDGPEARRCIIQEE